MKFTSPVYSAVSGSIAGITYSTNGGLIARARATPTNPNTLAQQNARSALDGAATAWGLLTSAQQSDWNDLAANTTFFDKLGNSFTPSGYMVFCRWASIRSLVGESDAQPATVAAGGTGEAPTAIAATDPTITSEITVTIGNTASQDGNVLVQISSPLSAGQNSLRRPLSFEAEADVSQDDASVVVTPTTTLVSGSRYVFRARLCYDDGRVSAAYEQIVTVTTSV